MKFTLLLALAPVLLQGADASLSYAPAPVRQLTVAGAAPAASLEFFDGVTPLGASVADGAGSAVLNALSLSPGLHTINVIGRGTGTPVAARLQIAVPVNTSSRFGSAASYALGIHPVAMGANGSIAAAGEGTVSTVVSGAAPAVFAGVTKPVAVLVADFNGDGANDVAVASAAGTLSIYLNNGSGTYSSAGTYQTGGCASSLAFADFNNDGVPDIAVANETEHTIAVLPGRPDGSFGTAVLFNSEVALRGMVAADLNGDGLADLAVTSYTSNTVSVLFGDGHGSFKPAGMIAANGPTQIAAGDFNEDGSTDLAVLSETSQTLTVWLNNGSGVFTSGASIANADSFAAGHVVGSSHLDLLVQTGSNLHVLAGAGNGTFADSATLSASGAAQLLAVGDFTGDGIADIAATDLSGVLSVFAAAPASVGPGVGTSNASGSLAAMSVRGQAWNAEALHTNTQIASSITLASSVSPSILSQAVTLTATLNPSSATGKVTFYAGPAIIGIAAVNGGGQASMTTSLLPSGTVSLSARYSGDSSFNPSFSSALSQSVTPLPQSGMSSNGVMTAGATPHGIVTGDFNNDGVTDIAVVDNAGSGIMVFLGNASGGFAAGVTIGANTSPFGIVAVDVNGDGNTDLVVTNNASEITVLLGNGAGSFSIFGTYPTGNNPQGIAAADFNRDGIADIVVSNFSDGTLTVLLGQGDGSFPTASTITVGTGPTSVAVADLNNDGFTDIAATNSSSGTVSVLAGNGDGTFQNGVTYSAGNQPYWVVAADLNNDGLVDLAVANNLTSGANVSVLVNKSTAPGTFPSRAAFTAGVSPHFLAIGDFNADGVPDLLVINKGTTAANGTYTIMTGTGTGTFTAGGNLAVGDAPWAAAVGDFNRDGRADAVVASSANNNINFLQGVGLYPDLTVAGAHTGNFTQGDAADTYTLTVSNIGSVSTTGTVTLTDAVPAGLTATAISGSGWTCSLAPLGCSRSDVLTAGNNYPDVTLTVSVASNAPLSVTNSVTVSGGGEVATGNDTANDPTVVIQTTTVALTSSLNPSTSGAAVTLTATISTTAATGSIVFYDGATPLRSVTVASGAAALTTSLLTAGSHSITARYSGDTQYGSSTSPVLAQVVATQLQNGFQAGVNLTLPITNPSGVTIADFNGDGNADIAVSNSSSSSKVTIFLGNGDGTFHSAVGYTSGSNTAPYAIVAADFNGDGAVDVAVANNNGNTVSVLLNNGDGTFQASKNVSAGTHPQHLAVGDFNSDGIPDLAVADYSTGIISILLGNGDGTFQALKSNTVGGNPRALVLRDFNGDGFTDIAVANFASNSVNLLLGKGDGTFQAGTTYSVGTNPQSITAGDFNGDGVVDLAVANNGSSNVTVLLGNGLGGFSVVAATPAAGTNPTGVVVNDFNGDGVLDLAVSDAGAGVSVLLGVGDGTFQAPLSYTAGTTPAALATDDFDKDGTSDLVVANGGSANITVLLGGLFYSDVTVAGSHVGNFTQGQNGAQYTMTVSNVGVYPTAGTVTATDTLPAGLTATAISGTGWTCTLSPLACKRGDSLAPGASYPDIAITVNVSKTANSSVTNTLTVSGGHESNAGNDSATDPTTILQNTTLILAPSVPNWVYAESVNLVATLSAPGATGTVTFYQDSTVLGTAPVSNGVATFAAPSLTPGTYTFNATYSGDSLYLGSSGTLTVIVGKATATVTLSGLSITWNGNPQSATVTTNPTGLSVSVTYNGLSTPPSDGGSYAVSATVNDPNYTGTANGTLVILPVQATVTLNIPSPTYDGNPHPATATTTPTGLAVSITYAGSGAAPTAAGTYQVHASVTTPNYTGSASGTLIITAAPVTITLSGLNPTYNGSPQAVGVTSNPTGVNVTVTYNGRGTAPTAAGTYSVSATSGDTNYTGSATGTLVIAKAPVTFTLTNLTWTYDGTAKAATVTSAPAGVSFSATYNGNSVAPTSAGSYGLAVASADGNYTGSASGTFTILQATPTVTWAQPGAMAFGVALSASQLNATSPVNGTFTYTPAVGTVLQPGTQPLSAVFSPSNSLDYATVTVNNSIVINSGPANGIAIVAANSLARDGNNNIVVTVTLSNTGNATANNVKVTLLKIATTAGTPLPFTVGTIPAQSSVQATFTVPGTAGTSGTSTIFSISGTFTGGSFSSSGRVVLP